MDETIHDYLKILANVIPIFLIMGLGGIVRQRGLLNEQADRTLMNLSVHVLMPCLILDRVVASEAVRDWRNLFWGPLLGFIVTAVGVRVAYLVGRKAGLGSPAAERTFGLTAGVFNYGYVAIPLVDALYNGAVGILFLFNLGVETAFWIVGFSLLEGRSPISEWRKVFTTPVQAILLAMAINLLTAAFGTRLAPEILEKAMLGYPTLVLLKTIHLVGLCSIPLALLLTGATMCDYWVTYWRSNPTQVTILSVVLRNFVLPVFMLSLAASLPNIPEGLKEVLIVQSAMPAGVFSLVLARHHGGDVMVALQVIFSTSVFALVTMPLWIHVGMLLCFGKG